MDREVLYLRSTYDVLRKECEFGSEVSTITLDDIDRQAAVRPLWKNEASRISSQLKESQTIRNTYIKITGSDLVEVWQRRRLVEWICLSGFVGTDINSPRSLLHVYL